MLGGVLVALSKVAQEDQMLSQGLCEHCDYTGNICVILYNYSKKDFIFKKGLKVAQLILEQIHTPSILEVHHLKQSSTRGSNAFGSSDKTFKVKLE